MAHTLPELPFAADSFAPWASRETFEYHHGKHHAGYVNKLNAAVEGTELVDLSLSETIDAARRSNASLYNLAAQHFNHSFFWNCLSPSEGEPQGQLAEFINRDLGSFESFKEQFSALALKHFGSGWVWLLQDESDKLFIRDYHDADTPAQTNNTPLLTLDVWEHAYYIDYRNDRAKFIEGFWDHINWEYVANQMK